MLVRGPGYWRGLGAAHGRLGAAHGRVDHDVVLMHEILHGENRLPLGWGSG